MKNQINEAKRMQLLAGIITENEVNENSSFEIGDIVFIKDNGQFETKPRQIHSQNGNYYGVSGHIKRDDGKGYSAEGGKFIAASDIKLADIVNENQLDESQLNEANEDAGAFVNKIFSTAKALGLVQMNMTDTDADERKFKSNFQKEGFPPNSHGILGVEKISNGMAISLVIMADDKEKLEKLEDVIDNTKGNFKPGSDFYNKSRIYKIENAAKDKEAFVHVFFIDLTSPSSAAAPVAESFDQLDEVVNKVLAKLRSIK